MYRTTILRRMAILGGIAVFASGVAMAGSVTGTASASFGNVSVSGFGSDFESADGSGVCDTVGAAPGCFLVGPSSGSFTNDLNPLHNTINDLQSPFADFAGPGSLLGSTQTTGFVSFDSGAVLMDLVEVFPGAAPNCNSFGDLSANGVTCTLWLPTGVGSQTAPTPYALTNANGVLIVGGTFLFDAYTGGDSSTFTPYIGSFSTNLSCLSALVNNACPQGAAANILDVATILGSGGAISSPWGATFTPAPETPEPTTLLLCGMGAILIGTRKLRRKS